MKAKTAGFLLLLGHLINLAAVNELGNIAVSHAQRLNLSTYAKFVLQAV